jgi:hypothetical protein
MSITPHASMPVAVIVERRAIDNPWIDHSWKAVEVLPGAPATAPWTPLAEGPDWTRYLAGVATLAMYKAETETYKYNIEAEAPAVYVFLRRADEPPGLRLLGATVCAGEVDAHSDAGDDIIEAVPMPPAVQAWVAEFVAEHHVERVFHKRKRDRADPEALAKGGRDRGSRG